MRATPPPLGFHRPTATSSAQIPDTHRDQHPIRDIRPDPTARPLPSSAIFPAHSATAGRRRATAGTHQPAHAPRPIAAIAPGQRRRSTQRLPPVRESFGRQSAPARHQGTHEPRPSAALAAVPAHDRTGWPFICRRGPRYARTGHQTDDISVQQVLEVVGHFDESGGARVSFTAWELSVEQQRFAPAWAQAWAQATAERLLRRAGRARLDREQLWRLTAGGWAARERVGRRSRQAAASANLRPPGGGCGLAAALAAHILTRVCGTAPNGADGQHRQLGPDRLRRVSARSWCSTAAVCRRWAGSR